MLSVSLGQRIMGSKTIVLSGKDGGGEEHERNCRKTSKNEHLKTRKRLSKRTKKEQW